MTREFRDRTEAGRLLAEKVGAFPIAGDAIVLALPRGGVPVGHEVARALGIPLDIILVRKLGTPGAEEMAMGAIAEGGVLILNHHLIETLEIPTDVIEEIADQETAELNRRAAAYRADRPPPSLAGRTVILVDDGLATGATMRSAIQAARHQHARRVIVAVPVAPPETCETLGREADKVVCCLTPENLTSIGSWYHDFQQTSDDEVRDYLSKSPPP